MADKTTQTTPGMWFAVGAVMLVGSTGMAWLARDFVYGSDMVTRPILPFVGALCGLGLLYWLFSCWLLRTGAGPTPAIAWWVLVVGGLMRLVMSFSQPVLEDDWYRYLWDGAVTAHGVNPYASSPQMVLEGETPHLDALATEAGIVLERVNHPEIGTVYPPIAQAAFAIAHRVAPWRLSGIRILNFAVDWTVLALLLALLRQTGRSPLYAALYWWNPLVVKECYNSAHMDLLVVPFLLGALLALFKNRVAMSAALLALATAVKVWPALLLLPLLATQWHNPRRALAAAAVFGGVTGVLFAPMYSTLALGEQAGIVAYGGRWEMNDALFMVFPWLVGLVDDAFGWGLSGGQIHRAGRSMAALITVAAALYCALRVAREPLGYACDQPAGRQRMAGLWCGIAATLFLVSPTQFPWYILWVMPLLPLVPRPSLLLLTALLPLYYLKFYFDARGQVDFFHYRLVWLEYAPVWFLLLWEWMRARGKGDERTAG